MDQQQTSAGQRQHKKMAHAPLTADEDRRTGGEPKRAQSRQWLGHDTSRVIPL
jgi:hypothetical protein